MPAAPPAAPAKSKGSPPRKTSSKTGQTVEFKLLAGADRQDVTAAMSLQGQASPVRLYLPANKAPVEIESIQYFPANVKPAMP